MIWNFFATRHWKGEVDGSRVLLKRELKKEQIKPHGQKLQNASDFVQFLKSEFNKYHAAHAFAKKQVNKLFWEIKVGDVDKSKGWECETLNGNQKMHQVRYVSHKDLTLLQCHELISFCMHCVDRNAELLCEALHHVPEWSLKRLKPLNTTDVRSMMYDFKEEFEARSGGEWIVEVVQVGDNVVICANNFTYESFWLMIVHKGVHIVFTPFKDA